MCRPRLAQPVFHRVDVFRAQIGLCDTAVHLHRAHCGDEYHSRRCDTRLAALDVHEFLGAKIGTEAGFSHHVIADLQRRGGGDDRVTAMGDVGEWAAMDERPGCFPASAPGWAASRPSAARSLRLRP